MTALRRGIARYQDGTEDVQQQQQLLLAPSSTVPKTTMGPVRPVPVVPASPVRMPSPLLSAPAAPPGSISNILTGQYGDVLADPNASAFAHYLAKSSQADVAAAQAAQNQERVQNLAAGPSPIVKLVKGIFGNQADWEAIKNHDAAAKVLGDPLVQRHLINNPDELTLAEKDPHGYVQSPVFKDVMQKAQDVHAELQKRPDIHPDDHPEIVNTKLKVPEATVDQIHASLKPHQYTRDEFINATEGMTTRAFHMIFGSQLAHVVTPQEALTKKYFDKLHNNYNTAAANVARMEAENQKAIDEKRNPPHQSSWFGKSLLDQEKEKMEFWNKKIMDDAAASLGITAKPYPVPGSIEIR